MTHSVRARVFAAVSLVFGLGGTALSVLTCAHRAAVALNATFLGLSIALFAWVWTMKS